jgi:hypothetical protein
MALGTGLTKGPYTPTADVSFSVSDPNVWGKPSTFVQIQNASGFTLTVATSGAPYSIQPQTATTIPTLGDGSVITITPSSGIANQVGTITTVWLLDEQNPPIPDGYLTSATANQRTALSNTVNGLSTYTGNVATLGTDQSALLILHPVAGSPTYSYSLKGNQSGILYASGSGTLGSTASTVLGPWPIYGNLDSTLALSITNNGINIISFDLLTLSSITNSFAPVKGGSNVGLGVYQYGGLSGHTQITLTSTTATTLLSAPASGSVYRLHLVGINTTGGSLNVQVYDDYALIAQLHAGTQNQIVLNGLLINSKITVKNSAVSSTDVAVRYDLITTPSIY